MSVRIFNHYFNVPFLLLGLGEALVFILSVYIAFSYCGMGSYCGAGKYGQLFPQAFVICTVMILSMLAMGLYQVRLEGYSSVIARILIGFTIGGLVLLAMEAAFSVLQIDLSSTLFILIVSCAAVCVLRVIFLNTVDTSLLKRRVLVYGAGRKADSILERFQNKIDQRGFVIVGFVHTNGDPDNGTASKRILHPKKSLCEFAREMGVDEIVDAVDDRRTKLPLRELLDCKAHGVNVVSLLCFFERESGSVNVSLLDPSWIIFSDGFKQTTLKTAFKRSLDLVASSILLAVTWPIMLITALAIMIESNFKGSVFYTQYRVGEKGKAFKIYKFRSMRSDAEKDGKAVWAQKNDSRVTKIGAFIRKTRIDELPQIINVFTGDMSFVGPRPERPEFDTLLKEKISYYDQRNQIKPGITGWAQLCYPYGASDKDALEKLQYDLYYVKNQSLMLDIIIILRTIEIILFGKGAR